MIVLAPRTGRMIRRWMDRRARRGRSVRLGYRQIFILPTRGGLLFAAMALAIWIGAVNYSNNMAFLLCFLLVGFSLVAMVHAFRNLLGLQITAGRPTAVFAGADAYFPVRLANPAPRDHHAVTLTPGDNPTTATDIPAGGEREAHLVVGTSQRGPLKLPVVEVETRFPGGLFRAWARVSLEVECLVRPAPESGQVPEPVSEHESGRAGSARQGDDDFSGLRTYQPADSLKRIAWRTLAQEQELQTKQFTGEGPGRVWLDYEATRHLPPEARLSRLCRWILDAEAEGRPYGLALPGQSIPPASGPGHADRCLDALARFPA